MTLQKFLQDHDAYENVYAEGSWVIHYEGHPCLVLRRPAMRGEDAVEIKPLSSLWDIGSGVGRGVHKTFLNPQQ